MVFSNTGSVGIFIKEYMRGADIYFIGDGYLRAKNHTGEIFRAGIGRWNNTGLSIGESYAFIQFLKRSVGMVKVNIRDEYSSNYLFSFNCNGFTKSLNAAGYDDNVARGYSGPWQ
jgi:hypothetical protein